MTPQGLKNSILQLAIQGKLVEQRPEEGTAAELLVGITIDDRVDGQRVKEKEITAISDSDISFDLPDSWEWIKLGSVCTIARGGSPRPIKEYITDAEDGVNWIKIGDTEKDGKYISSTAEKIRPSGVPKSRVVHAGDFLLTNSMSFGRPYILKIDGCIHDGWLVISQSAEVFDQDYLYWLLSSGYAYSQFCGKVSGAVVKNLNSDKVANSVFPLPPLAEQKRIVARIEELLPLIDRYEKAWSRLEDFNKRFPGDMQKSILQMAIQGKLVEQRPEEGTGEDLYRQIQAEKQALIRAGKVKKEKSFSQNIQFRDYPFDIPDSWIFVRFGELMISRDAERIPVSTSERSHRAKVYDYYGASGVIDKIDDYLFDKELLLIGEDGANLLARSTPIAFLARGKYWVNNHAHVLDACGGLNLQYVCYFINAISLAPYVTGTAQPKMNQENMNAIWVPLPPLAEQKRIVARLEELLPLCEKLK